MHHELDTVTVEYDDGSCVGHLTLNRPDSLNALNDRMNKDILAAWRGSTR